ncbi:MAG: winged helix-turn-helix transcriptional regulator [Candidatus Cloacimonetes bacterium]|nr:winged helix-turn-helix transcriptional regulator [Candidatus Cloacimonadota bacterium]
MDLAREEDRNFLLNNACVLLFSKHLSDIYYHTKIICVRFKGDTRVKIIDKKDFNQDIFSNIENAINFLKQYIPLEFIIEDVRRKERYTIPIPVLREAVVNASVHRDYFEKGANVQINVFDNSIEISNPGGLIFDKKYFGQKSASRNPLLLDIFARTPLVEKVGSGISRMREDMKTAGLEEPEFNLGDFFTATFKGKLKHRVNTPQKSPQITPQKTITVLEDKIINEIYNDPKITRVKIASKLYISSDTVKEYLKRLKRKGLLQRVGSDRNGYWKIMGERIATFKKKLKSEVDTPTKTPTKTTTKTTTKTITALESRILSEVSNNPNITGNKIASKLNISLNTVREYIIRLKKKGLLQRIGPNRGGYWKVTKSR